MERLCFAIAQFLLARHLRKQQKGRVMALSTPTAKVQHDGSQVYLVLEDENGKKEARMSGLLARELGEALFKTGCIVDEPVRDIK